MGCFKLTYGEETGVLKVVHNAFKTNVKSGSDTDRYGYQGEYAECDPETATTSGSESIGGWNSFDLRMYDANVGRWLSVDPKGQYWSPYTGMGNNPISGYDPDGGGTQDDITYNSATKTQSAPTPTNDNYDRYFVDGKLVGFGTKGQFTFSENGYVMQKPGTTGGVAWTGSESGINHILTNPAAPARYLNTSDVAQVVGNIMVNGGQSMETAAWAISAHGAYVLYESGGDPLQMGFAAAEEGVAGTLGIGSSVVESMGKMVGSAPHTGVMKLGVVSNTPEPSTVIGPEVVGAITSEVLQAARVPPVIADPIGGVVGSASSPLFK